MNSIILAQAAQQAQGEGWNMLITFGLIIIIFYFIVIRPQRKQQKELKERQDSLKPGDKVITNGGIYGIVREVKDDTVKLEIAANTVIKVVKTCIVQGVGKDGATEGK